ncbi:MAG: hypothetical protein JNK87_02940 [Bryobacterales bacterium]|nr:hypothetical protein [Bryobacterales bacterium]
MLFAILAAPIGDRTPQLFRFQDIVFNDKHGIDLSDQEQSILGDLAYDLDFYQPDPAARRHPCYGEDRLATFIHEGLQTLALEHPEWRTSH